MRELDASELKLCSIQADIFASSTSRTACSSAIFVRRFMNSRMARRMDESGLGSAPPDTASAYRLLDEEYGPSSYGSTTFSSDELHWMGYLYRYWCCACALPSKAVYGIASARKLRGLYAPYHTLDPSQAVERIMEASGKPLGEDLIERGVRILKELRCL